MSSTPWTDSPSDMARGMVYDRTLARRALISSRSSSSSSTPSATASSGTLLVDACCILCALAASGSWEVVSPATEARTLSTSSSISSSISSESKAESTASFTISSITPAFVISLLNSCIVAANSGAFIRLLTIFITSALLDR
uniref:Uncharacterized protein n=1 Tax=Arundo donax TaxID=35708 RepID=A0A0A9DLP6_ARUDO